MPQANHEHIVLKSCNPADRNSKLSGRAAKLCYNIRLKGCNKRLLDIFGV